MAKRDYYEALGVAKNAGDAQIKKAFKRQAMKYHPDRNPDDKSAEEKFKEIKEAYDVLSNTQKRAAYDQFGHAGVDPASAAEGSGGGSFSDVFGDVFGDIFGGGSARSGQRVYRGADLRYNLDLSLEEAVHGTTVKIRVPILTSCDDCNGSGARKGTRPSTCSACGGHGQVRMQQGFFSLQQTCPRCQGSGKIIDSPCKSCRGQGRVRQNKTLSVKVPAGVDNSDRIRLANEGEAGEQGGPPGDLYVHMQVREHPIFQRDGDDLLCEVPIGVGTASLGGEFEMPTLNGRVKLKIPAETQTGKLFRLRGKGVKSVRSSAVGDLLCRVVVETPVNLTRKQKELLQEFENTLQQDGPNHSPRTSSWMDNVKSFFEGMKS